MSVSCCEGLAGLLQLAGGVAVIEEFSFKSSIIHISNFRMRTVNISGVTLRKLPSVLSEVDSCVQTVVNTAKINDKLSVNEYPNVIVTGEAERDILGSVIVRIHLAVRGHRERNGGSHTEVVVHIAFFVRPGQISRTCVIKRSPYCLAAVAKSDAAPCLLFSFIKVQSAIGLRGSRTLFAICMEINSVLACVKGIIVSVGLTISINICIAIYKRHLYACVDILDRCIRVENAAVRLSERNVLVCSQRALYQTAVGVLAIVVVALVLVPPVPSGVGKAASGSGAAGVRLVQRDAGIAGSFSAASISDGPAISVPEYIVTPRAAKVSYQILRAVYIYIVTLVNIGTVVVVTSISDRSGDMADFAAGRIGIALCTRTAVVEIDTVPGVAQSVIYFHLMRCVVDSSLIIVVHRDWEVLERGALVRQWRNTCIRWRRRIGACTQLCSLGNRGLVFNQCQFQITGIFRCIGVRCIIIALAEDLVQNAVPVPSPAVAAARTAAGKRDSRCKCRGNHRHTQHQCQQKRHRLTKSTVFHVFTSLY